MNMNALPVLTGGRFRASEQSARATGIARPGTRILIVDDEVDLLDMLAAYFVEYKYNVATATNGADALMAVSRQRPDVVLLDIHMPRMDGVETLKEIMKTDQSIAVIMVTGNLELDITVEAIRNGAFAYVPKPFDLRYLDHLIAASLSRSGTTALKRIPQ
jgi:DNA-binding NtrC family response regulator